MNMHAVLLIGAKDFSGFKCWYQLPEVDVSYSAGWSTVSATDREASDVVLVEYKWLVHLTTKDNIAFFSAFSSQPIIVLFDTTQPVDRESLIAIGVQAVWSVEELQHVALIPFLENAIERQRRLQEMEDEGREVSALIGKLKAMDVQPTDYVSGVTKILDAEWVEQSALMLKKVREQNDYLQKIAHHDGLTGLITRELFNEFFSATLSRVQRHEKQVALLYFDIDHFKQVNDTYGHPSGDQLLQQIAQRLRQVLRDEDLVARFGGDEFAVLLTEIANASAAGLVARKIMTALSDTPYQLEDYTINITVSIGIACYPFAGDTVAQLSKHADMALYRSKRGGRNRYQFFTNKINRQMVRRMTLERELDGAIEHDELQLVLQPNFTINNHVCPILNASINWMNRKYGIVSPKEFMPIAQQSHVMLDIGYWLMLKLVKQINLWQKQSSNARSLQYSIPLTFLQLSDQQFLPTVQSLISDCNVNADQLIFEIDQAQWSLEGAVDIASLQPLVELGCQVSMGRFGSAEMNLDRLIKMPFISSVIIEADTVGCSSDIEHSKLSLLISLASTMGWSVVVRDVQTAEEIECLQQLQVSQFSLHPQNLLLDPASVNQFLSQTPDPLDLLAQVSRTS
ncbi:MAG: diguanylate cyclase [Coxiellaceae bacterium]|nr:diguanylate cyclase [Coxiellaceae bacterium]